jgi:hypothetical protein
MRVKIKAVFLEKPLLTFILHSADNKSVFQSKAHRMFAYLLSTIFKSTRKNEILLMLQLVNVSFYLPIW